jgi:uncharacterized protein (DUF2062 family)
VGALPETRAAVNFRAQKQVASWGPALEAGFPMAGAVLGLLAYERVCRGWSVLIRRERRQRQARRSAR